MPSRAVGRFIPLLSLSLSFVLGSGGRLLAAGGDDDAEAAIKKGIELRRRGDDAQALEQFKRAYSLTRWPRALGQMGFAEQALGRWREAEEHLGRALADTSADDGWIKKNRATLERSRAIVAAHLGSLEILGEPVAAEVRVEGRFVGTLPFARPLRVPAGTVGLEVRADGCLATSRLVTIVPGELTRETVTLQRRTAPVPGPGGTTSGETVDPAMGASPHGGSATREPAIARVPGAPGAGVGTWLRPAAWVTAGAAVVFAGGLVVGLLARRHDSAVIGARFAAGTCTQIQEQFKGPEATTCAMAATHRDRATILGVVSGGVGAAFAITSAILFVTSPAANPRALACAPSVAGWSFRRDMTASVDCGLRF